MECSLTPTWPHPVCLFAWTLHIICIGNRGLWSQGSFMWNLPKIPELYLLSSWGAVLGVSTRTAALHDTSASCLCCPRPQGSPTLRQWQQQSKTVWVGGAIAEQQPGC